MSVTDTTARGKSIDDPDTFVVLVPKGRLWVTLRVDTKRLAEERRIERINDEIRRVGK